MHSQRQTSGQENNEREREILAEISSLKDTVVDLRNTLAEVRELISNQPTVKDSYSTKEVAEILGKRPYTVREWCRGERINAYKALFGRGCEEEWRISHEELSRIQNDGLLPLVNRFRSP